MDNYSSDTPGTEPGRFVKNRTRDTLSTLDPVHVGSSLAGDSSVRVRLPRGAQVPEQEPKATCALRALTLCDGQVLEHPDRALTGCLCDALQRSMTSLPNATQLAIAVERAELIERAMTAPPLPLPARG